MYGKNATVRKNAHPATVLRHTNLRLGRVRGNVAIETLRGTSGSGAGPARHAGPATSSLVEDLVLGAGLRLRDGLVQALAVGQDRRVGLVEQVLQAGGVLRHRVLRLYRVLGVRELGQVVLRHPVQPEQR